MAEKKKKEKRLTLSEWFDLPKEEMEKRTMQAAKGYLAHKSELLSSQFAHPEYMEQSELLAEQIKDLQDKSGEDIG